MSCIGNARPLEQALQHATTEMLSLLVEDYRLSVNETSLLLGQVVEYEVANVFNPAYSVACKIPSIFTCSQILAAQSLKWGLTLKLSQKKGCAYDRRLLRMLPELIQHTS
ncbi:hypothetical protein [Brevibacillus sp. DP1.3A]|uniref:hypothetical protein n=1 Tax=Brevibacillus sp. DP1.3A TaxID=2738867 RepID=UPI001D1678F4|nr:hypothetical protein [Brevibacillus sp. DP1.3A]UED74520.1 hypothetical protein HP399_028010 [Brevibacillus sp. DP1.3A]